MTLPPHYLSRPEADWSPPALAAFDELAKRSVFGGDGSLIDYTLPMPKWQFLCHIADRHDVLLHGSGAPDIAEFEPRQSESSDGFGDQRAVYASSDALWAMYFGIVDRPGRVWSLVNACFGLTGQDPNVGRRYYF